MYTFLKLINAMWNAKVIFHDLNLVHHVHFSYDKHLAVGTSIIIIIFKNVAYFSLQNL